MTKKKREREEKLKEQSQSYDYGKYKTKFTDLVREQEAQYKEKLEEREEER